MKMLRVRTYMRQCLIDLICLTDNCITIKSMIHHICITENNIVMQPMAICLTSVYIHWFNHIHLTGNSQRKCQNFRNKERGGQTGHGAYYTNQRGQGSECGYYNPCQLTSIPTLYIQQAPVTNTTTNALSMITNTDTSSNYSLSNVCD